MNAMGYDAMAIGGRDAAGGPDLLQARLAEAKFAVLSANLTLGGKLVAKPYTIIKRGGVTVAVLGLTTPRVGPLPAGLAVSDPVQAAQQYVPKLRQQADIVVILGALGPDLEQKLVAQVPGFDFLIGGGVSDPSPTMVDAHGPAVVHVGTLGEYLGVTTLALNANHRPISYSFQALALDPSFADDPEVANLLRRYGAQ